jgi:hypothetical protein
MDIIDQILENVVKSGIVAETHNAYPYVAGMAFAMLTDEQQKEILAITERKLSK